MLEGVVPIGVECVALCRGAQPRTLWARLWDWVGLRLARRAGWTVVVTDPVRLPRHVNCRCIVHAPGADQAQRPFGAPGVRDEDHPCDLFAPGKPAGSCYGDGHALCRECTEWAALKEG